MKARNLFRRFHVFFLTEQLRAAECERQQDLLSDCRRLPDAYPLEESWEETPSRNYNPISSRVISATTRELTDEDLRNDSAWKTDSRILVTSNTDKATLTQCAMLHVAQFHQSVIVRWKREITQAIPDYLRLALYDEDVNPKLFGYFTQGAIAQILDNSNGNLDWGIANGTMCQMHSLGWDDDSKTRIAAELINSASPNDVVDLPFPPEYINVVLLNSDGQVATTTDWPEYVNLDQRQVNEHQEAHILLPMGLVRSNANRFTINLAKKRVLYAQHAVDAAFALTIWKAQGTTLPRVILLLEGSPHSRPWQFEHIYVGISRVRALDHVRCLPLSRKFKRAQLRNLRPSIFTIKWIMDIRDDGYWHQN